MFGAEEGSAVAYIFSESLAQVLSAGGRGEKQGDLHFTGKR